jgi:DNA-binding NtrC family response regulator
MRGRVCVKEAPMRPILIVDDEPNTRFALRYLLEKTHRVATAECAEEALERLEHEPFDVVLADLALPGRDGLWLLARVRERWPATRRVLISGQSGVCASLLMSSDIAQAFLEKPASVEELLAAISSPASALAPAG